MTQTTTSTSAQWKLVPVEPTKEMVRQLERGEQEGYCHVWPDVLDASPSPAASPASPSGVRVKPLEEALAEEREMSAGLAKQCDALSEKIQALEGTR